MITILSANPPLGEVSLKADKKFDWNLPVTEKVADVLRAFGITVQRLKNNAITHQCDIKLSSGQIAYITGPSGSGKSVLLREFYNTFAGGEKINIDDIPLPDDKTCVDCIDPTPIAQCQNQETTDSTNGNRNDFGLGTKQDNRCGVLETLRNLSCAGLTDVFCVLNSPANLSEGQKYRYRIAKAITSDKQFIFADEFCSNLDRVTAAIISYNLRKFATKTGKIFVLASSHDDLLVDLLPDVIVIKHLAGEAEVIYKNPSGVSHPIAE
ncbi:MAG: ATP-binding cassette domain-containing protein [Sedimentisphaerales bacterium]